MTTPTSRRRDVRASTATAPAADEERGAELSPALAKKRENGCRLLLLRYAGRVGNPVRATSAALSPSRAYLRHEANSLPQPHAVTTLAISLPFSHPPALSPSLPFRRLHSPRSLSPSPSLVLHRRRHYPTTGFLATNTPPRTPYPPPSTLPCALPASSDPHGHDREPRPTESCRLSASQPSDSPPRHATPRAACVSLHRVSKACEREKPCRASLVP